MHIDRTDNKIILDKEGHMKRGENKYEIQGFIDKSNSFCHSANVVSQ